MLAARITAASCKRAKAKAGSWLPKPPYYQLEDGLVLTQEVAGSSPAGGTKYENKAGS